MLQTVLLLLVFFYFDDLDQSIEFRSGGNVKIENLSGDIRIEVWAEELVHLTARKSSGQVNQTDLSIINTKNLIQLKVNSDSKTRFSIVRTSADKLKDILKRQCLH